MVKQKKQRAWELDAIRGLSILAVIWDHVNYDLARIFWPSWRYMEGAETLTKIGEFSRSYLNGELRVWGWPIFVFLFFFVSGACTTFSRNNFWRGLKLALVAVAVSGVTYILENYIGMSGSFILFGVLHCLACCILIFAVVELILFLFRKFKYYRTVKFVVFFALALVAIYLHFKYNVMLWDTSVNNATVATDSKIAGMFIYTSDWWTADYFPLLPFVGFFFIGATFAQLAYPEKKSLMPKLDGKWHYFLTIPGRYSLWIYLALQVVAIGIIALISLIITGQPILFA